MKKHLLFLLLAVLIPSVSRADYWQDPNTKVNYEYEPGSGEATVVSCELGGNISILSSFTVHGEYYKVTSIGGAAFYNCWGITSITIPSSVTSFGRYAFEGTQWYDNLPDGLVYINNVAYKYKGTMPENTSIEIKEGTLSISDDAFYDCSSLTSIEIPNSVTSIGNYAFSECSALTSVTIGNGVTSIGNYAFYKCSSLPSIMIPNGVKSIGEAAFQNCWGITSITIPNSVTSIGEAAFQNCWGITSITIPNSVTSIGGQAFRSCRGLTSITIPNSVTSIGNSAFSGCSGLTSITIPNSVTSIGDGAFSGCSGLTSITIPNSVTSIGDDTFRGCSGLTSVIVDENNTVYDSRDNCNAIIRKEDNTLILGCQNTIIPNSVTSIGERAFYNCDGLTSITIPNSVTSIGDGAFSGCSGLTSITIPNSVTSIGDGAFSSCSGLTTVKIGNSVTSFGDEPFSNCNGLASITVDENNTVYDSRDNCNAIIRKEDNTLILGCQNTIIPNSVTSIGERAFYNCDGLTSITIPNSVTSIGDGAFEGCSGLTTVKIGNSVTSFGNESFSDCNGLASITVDENNTVYDSRDNCNAIIRKEDNTLILGCQNTIIPNSVTSIGGGAFWFCSGLTSITIPNSVTSIENFAFYGCTALTSITIPNSVKNIGVYAFVGGLLTVISEIEEPFRIIPGTFFNYPNLPTLYVPVGKIDLYKATEGWDEFEIKEIQDVAVTLTANSYNRVYGDNNPEFGYTVTEGVIVSGNPSLSCEATNTSTVGTYDIIVEKSSVSNNTVNLVNGTLTITKAPLTIKVDSYSRKQGEENPEFVLTFEGFKNDETADVLTVQPTVTTEAVAASEPGKYAITISGAEAQNYEISYVPGELTVTEADPVTLTAKSYTREYGEENPTFGFTTEGAALDGEPIVECEATATSAVGTYDITIKKGGVKNYNDTYVNGTLTITKAPLKVGVKDAERAQGEENPQFELVYEGWKLQDTESVLLKKPVATTTATKDSPAGEYVITISGGEAQNYALTYKSGKLTVTMPNSIGELMKTGKAFDVYDMNGRKVRRQTTTLEDLPKGVYIIGGKKVVVK